MCAKTVIAGAACRCLATGNNSLLMHIPPTESSRHGRPQTHVHSCAGCLPSSSPSPTSLSFIPSFSRQVHDIPTYLFSTEPLLWLRNSHLLSHKHAGTLANTRGYPYFGPQPPLCENHTPLRAQKAPAVRDGVTRNCEGEVRWGATFLGDGYYVPVCQRCRWRHSQVHWHIGLRR